MKLRRHPVLIHPSSFFPHPLLAGGEAPLPAAAATPSPARLRPRADAPATGIFAYPFRLAPAVAAPLRPDRRGESPATSAPRAAGATPRSRAARTRPAPSARHAPPAV